MYGDATGVRHGAVGDDLRVRTRAPRLLALSLSARLLRAWLRGGVGLWWRLRLGRLGRRDDRCREHDRRGGECGTDGADEGDDHREAGKSWRTLCKYASRLAGAAPRPGRSNTRDVA